MRVPILRVFAGTSRVTTVHPPRPRFRRLWSPWPLVDPTADEEETEIDVPVLVDQVCAADDVCCSVVRRKRHRVDVVEGPVNV